MREVVVASDKFDSKTTDELLDELLSYAKLRGSNLPTLSCIEDGYFRSNGDPHLQGKPRYWEWLDRTIEHVVGGEVKSTLGIAVLDVRKLIAEHGEYKRGTRRLDDVADPAHIEKDILRASPVWVSKTRRNAKALSLAMREIYPKLLPPPKKYEELQEWMSYERAARVTGLKVPTIRRYHRERFKDKWRTDPQQKRMVHRDDIWPLIPASRQA